MSLIDITRRQVAAAGALLIAGCAAAPDRRAAAAAELGPTGRLRAAINYGNPILASRGPQGEPVGVSVDLAREAARRLGLPIERVTFNAAGMVVEAVKSQQVDLAFVAIDPLRAVDMAYTAPYVIIEGAYLEQMKASGFVAEALRRHRIEGAAVAPRAL